MFTILNIKKLKKQNNHALFLTNFKKELKSYMAENPVVMEKTESRPSIVETIKFTYFNKLNLKTMPILIIAMIALMGGGGVAAASQSSLPNSPLYPVKILTEEVRENIALSSASKADLHAHFAARRVEEVGKMLAEKGIDPKGLQVAMENLKKHVDESANIVDDERNKGADVKDLAERIQDKIEKAKANLEERLNQAGEKATSTNEKKLLKEKIEKAKAEIEENEDKIGKSEEFKKSAEVAIAEAKSQFEIVKLGLATSSSSLASSTNLFAKYDEFMKKAENAMTKEHWVQARQHAKQAVIVLKNLERRMEEMEKKSDDQEKKATSSKSMRIEKEESLDQARQIEQRKRSVERD